MPYAYFYGEDRHKDLEKSQCWNVGCPFSKGLLEALLMAKATRSTGFFVSFALRMLHENRVVDCG